MLEFTTNGKNGSYEIKLPTSLNEITPDYLLDVTSEINVADNYSLIAICYREVLSTILFANSNKKKEVLTSIVPIFVKAGKTDNEFINRIATTNKLIISASDISLGHHVTSPLNKITVSNILYYTEGDTKLYKEAMTYKDKCCFIEFKLVPNCNINGYYDSYRHEHKDCPFVKSVAKD